MNDFFNEAFSDLFVFVLSSEHTVVLLYELAQCPLQIHYKTFHKYNKAWALGLKIQRKYEKM